MKPSSRTAPDVERGPDGRFKRVLVNFYQGPNRLHRGTVKILYSALLNDNGDLTRELLVAGSGTDGPSRAAP